MESGFNGRNKHEFEHIFTFKRLAESCELESLAYCLKNPFHSAQAERRIFRHYIETYPEDFPLFQRSGACLHFSPSGNLLGKPSQAA